MRFSERGGWWVVAQVVLFGAILAAAWTLGPGTVDGWGRQLGTALFWVGVALGLAGAVPLGADLSPFPAPTATSRLRTGGIFALVRHPIYGGVILIFMGISLRAGSIVAVVLSMAMIGFFWFKSSHEERLLADRFADYNDYRQRVTRRFIPWLF